MSFGADGLAYERALVEQSIADLRRSGKADADSAEQLAHLQDDLQALSLQTQ